MIEKISLLVTALYTQNKLWALLTFLPAPLPHTQIPCFFLAIFFRLPVVALSPLSLPSPPFFMVPLPIPYHFHVLYTKPKLSSLPQALSPSLAFSGLGWMVLVFCSLS